MSDYTNYTNRELQAFVAAKCIQNDQICIIGTGLPLIAGSLAKQTNAPDCHLITESGIMDIAPPEVPGSVSDLRFMMHCSAQIDAFRYLGLELNSLRRKSLNVLGFIGGAQVDIYGNVNSTVIGDYNNPKTRIAGSGGANGIEAFVNTFLVIKHSPRNFVEKVDYITSPGWLDGPDGRKKVGLPENIGPQMVISDLGTFKFDDETKRMYLNSYFPGITIDEIKSKTGFELDCSRAYQEEAPSPEIVRIIREVIDPNQVFIKRPAE